jgi:hypothetical protein
MLWWRIHAVVIIGLLVLVTGIATAGLLLRPLLLTAPDGNNRTPALAAAIAVTGVLTTGAVTFIGVVLRQSIDLRTTRMAERASELAQVEQRRLLMETALQTVKLLSREDGQAASTPQVSAALLVLARLGETHLAIDLAAELWPGQQVSTTTAVQLAQEGLSSQDVSTQQAAAMLLRNNAKRLQVTDTQYEWPDILETWNLKLPSDVRVLIAVTLATWVQERTPKSQQDFRLSLLRDAQSLDPSPEVQLITHSIVGVSKSPALP